MFCVVARHGGRSIDNQGHELLSGGHIDRHDDATAALHEFAVAAGDHMTHERSPAHKHGHIVGDGRNHIELKHRHASPHGGHDWYDLTFNNTVSAATLNSAAMPTIFGSTHALAAAENDKIRFYRPMIPASDRVFGLALSTFCAPSPGLQKFLKARLNKLSSAVEDDPDSWTAPSPRKQWQQQLSCRFHSANTAILHSALDAFLRGAVHRAARAG